MAPYIIRFGVKKEPEGSYGYPMFCSWACSLAMGSAWVEGWAVWSPAIAAGGWGVHVPHDLTWDFERAEAPARHPRFAAIADLSGLAEVVDRIAGG